jgi:hypothetical protein
VTTYLPANDIVIIGPAGTARSSSLSPRTRSQPSSSTRTAPGCPNGSRPPHCNVAPRDGPRLCAALQHLEGTNDAGFTPKFLILSSWQAREDAADTATQGEDRMESRAPRHPVLASGREVLPARDAGSGQARLRGAEDWPVSGHAHAFTLRSDQSAELQGRCRVADDEQGAPAMIDDEARRGCCEKLGVYKLVGTAR